MTANVSEDSFGGEENVLKLNVVMAAQLYKIYEKSLSCILYKGKLYGM